MSELCKKIDQNIRIFSLSRVIASLSCDRARGLQTTRSDRNGKYVTVWNKRIRALIRANQTSAAQMVGAFTQPGP